MLWVVNRSKESTVFGRLEIIANQGRELCTRRLFFSFLAPIYTQQFPSDQAYGEHHGRHLRVLGDPGERVDASELALVHRSELFL